MTTEAMRERSIAAAGEPGLRYVSEDRLEPSDVERASPLSEVLRSIARTGLTLEPARR